MNTIGVLLLAAATSTGGLFGKAHVGGKKLLKGGVVAEGAPPPGGMIAPPVGPGGAGGPGGGAQAGRRFPNVRSQIFFVDPPGMKIGWQTAAGAGSERVYLPAQLTAPARYNFTQGYIYRLKLTDIPGQNANFALYPSIEVAPSTPATDAYLTHNPIPAIFTEEDFDQVKAGNFVTKVIYLPDPKFQELAVSGVETLVSTRLEPGVNPILEADRRGTILMIIRLGGIDLEMPVAGASMVPGMAPGTATTPGITPTLTPDAAPVTAPPAYTPKPAAPTPAVPVDPQPPVPAPEVPKPGDTPAEKPADAPAAPAEKPADAPADKPADAPPADAPKS
jgi:hypothetical protein